jgi:hypothetical protein
MHKAQADADFLFTWMPIFTTMELLGSSVFKQGSSILRKHMMPANGQMSVPRSSSRIASILDVVGSFLAHWRVVSFLEWSFFCNTRTYRMMNRAEIVCRRRNLNCLHVHMYYSSFWLYCQITDGLITIMCVVCVFVYLCVCSLLVSRYKSVSRYKCNWSIPLWNTSSSIPWNTSQWDNKVRYSRLHCSQQVTTRWGRGQFQAWIQVMSWSIYLLVIRWISF